VLDLDTCLRSLREMREETKAGAVAGACLSVESRGLSVEANVSLRRLLSRAREAAATGGRVNSQEIKKQFLGSKLSVSPLIVIAYQLARIAESMDGSNEPESLPLPVSADYPRIARIDQHLWGLWLEPGQPYQRFTSSSEASEWLLNNGYRKAHVI
jgi:hypothetical protein